MLGDGGIASPWQAVITLNSVKDADYSGYVCALIKNLFGIVPASSKHKTRNALRIIINSTTVVRFLVSEGLSMGNKLKQGLAIPAWILSKKEYAAACVRGLVDTDGCMFVHKHTVAGKEYKNIGLTFSSRSPRLISQVAALFEEFGIIPHITKRGQDIYLYRADAVARYLRVFGTSNERIRSVYERHKGGVG